MRTISLVDNSPIKVKIANAIYNSDAGLQPDEEIYVVDITSREGGIIEGAFGFENDEGMSWEGDFTYDELNDILLSVG